MKKWMTFLMICAGIISAGTGIGVAMWLIKKRPVSVAIIGDADGPTSIFLAGKIGKKKS